MIYGEGGTENKLCFDILFKFLFNISYSTKNTATYYHKYA